MARYFAPLILFTIVLILAAASVAEPPTQPRGDAASEALINKLTTTVVYSVADLPVWNCTPRDQKATFDPSLLTTHIKIVVAPDSWNEIASIRPFTENSSLVVTQTRENHAKISELLDTLHDEADARRVVEFRKVSPRK